MARKSPTTPPPDPTEEELEDREVQEVDDTANGNPWFAALGGRPFEDPRETQQKTKLKEQLATMPIAAAGVDGAVQWLIEVRNDASGEADFLGYAHLEIGYPAFIARYIDAMPKVGADPVQFYFTPLDKLGAKLTTKPVAGPTIPWTNAILQKIRAGSTPQLGGIEAILLAQIAEQKEERKRAEERALKAEERALAVNEAALKERLSHAATMQSDVSAAYTAVGKVQQEGFSSVLSASEKISQEREKRDEERARRDRELEDQRRQREKDAAEAERARLRDQAIEERDRLRAENAAQLERVKAENAAALERVRAETEARKAELETRARLEEARINAEVEKAKAAALAEQARIRADQEREDARRRDEQARRDKLDADERERAREHAKSMEVLRTDMMNAEKERLAQDRIQNREHMNLQITLLEKRFAPEGSKEPFGVLGTVLNSLGMTPGDAIEKAKELFGGGGGGLGAVIAQGVIDLGKEIVKRLPMDEGEEEEEEEEGEVEQVRHAPPRRERQIEKKESLPAQEGKSPLDRFLSPPGETTPAIPLAERKAGRAAVESAVERISALKDGDDWGAAIMGGSDVDALVNYVTRVGLTIALEGYEIDAERFGAALVKLGLFESPPLQPSKG